MFGENSKDIHAVAPIPTRLRKNEKIAMITGDKVEDSEFFYPYYRLTEAGYQVDVITQKGGKFAGIHGIGLEDSKSIAEVRPEDYALLYLPGGKAPAQLRKDQSVIDFVKQFAATGKPIAAICHGPQILITADLVQGREIACYPEVAEELQKAGGIFVDEALVEDGQYVTARMPGDLHRHLYGTLQVLEGKASATPSKDERQGGQRSAA